MLKKGSAIPIELLKPIAQLRKDSELPLPPLDEQLGKMLSNLPSLPFEGKLVSMLQGRIEQALPKMPWE